MMFYCDNNNITGHFPSLDNNIGLKLLDFFNNKITSMGAITGAKNLEALNCHNNLMSGFAPSLDGLSALRIFSCHTNDFTGPVPSLDTNVSLTGIYLYNNDFTSFPSLSNNTKLVYMAGANNVNMTGELPNLNYNKELLMFNVNNCNFTLTNSISGASKLTYFDCHSNAISGALPDIHGLSALKDFICYNNFFTGNISVDNNTSLERISVSNNRLTSVSSLTGAPNLKYLFCHTNKISGNMPDITRLSSLETIDIYTNALTGAIQSLTTNTRLTAFRFYSNKISNVVYSPAPSSIRLYSASNNNFNLQATYNCLSSFYDTATVTPSFTGVVVNLGGTTMPRLTAGGGLLNNQIWSMVNYLTGERLFTITLGTSTIKG
jgi:hypothetical protein